MLAKNFYYSTFIVSLLSVFTASISFLNQLVLARYFGTGAEMESYLVAVSLPVTFSGLISGMLNYLLVPALQYAKRFDRGSEALTRSLALGLGSGATIIALMGIATSDRLFMVLVPGLLPAQHAIAVELAHITWLFLPISILSAIYVAGLHVKKKFAVSTFLLSWPIIGSIVVCLIAPSQFGVRAVAWGQLLGYISMVGTLRFIHGSSQAGWDWTGLRQVLANFPQAIAAGLIFVLYPFSDAFWGSRIGPGTVPYLGYAQRLLVGFSGLAVVGLTTVLFPRLAQHAMEGKAEALRNELGTCMRIMLICMVPGATAFSMLATPSVQLLFQRGSFHLKDTITLGTLLPVMLFGMVAMSCTGLIFKALFARQESGMAGALSVSGAFVYFSLSGLLGSWLGIIGIGIAYAVSWWLVFGFGVVYLWREVPIIKQLYGNYRFVLQLVEASLLVALVCWLGGQFLPSETSSDNIRRLLVVAATWISACATYLGFCHHFPALPELGLIRKRVLPYAGHQNFIT